VSTQTTNDEAPAGTGHDHEEHDAEGNSIAAWTAVVIMLVGFAFGTIAFCAAIPALVWVGAAVLVIGPIVGGILKKMGYGVGGHRYVPKAHG
jgi:hypothetical protein